MLYKEKVNVAWPTRSKTDLHNQHKFQIEIVNNKFHLQKITTKLTTH